MPKEIFDYLKSQRVGVLAVEMMDGSPHAAAIHFAHMEDPLVFYFETLRDYRKAQPLLERKVTRASLVVGSSEQDMKTLQLDGFVEIIQPSERDNFDLIYLGKFPEKIEKFKNLGNNSQAVLFKLTSTWWRFTDWKTPDGKKIWTSDKK